MDLDLLPLPGAISDNKGQVLAINTLLAKLLGYEKKDLVHKNLLSLTQAGDKQKIFNGLKNAISGKQSKFTCQLINNQGKNIHTQISVSSIDHNNILLLVCDITEFKNTEEKLLSTIIASEEKERRRIAAELHDNLSPILSTIKLYTDLLKKKTSGQDSELINNIEQLTDLAITTAKEISYNITPGILHDYGLAEAIKKFADFINKTQSLKIIVKSSQYNLTERTIAEAVLYQAAKELINNTIKHARASQCIIELRSTSNSIILYYRDNGKGFNVRQTIEKSNGLGLINLIHKVNSLKGRCDFHSEPGGGFIAIISIPVQTSKNITYV